MVGLGSDGRRGHNEFPEESDKIERYVGGLPDMIRRSVVASKPKTMQEAIEMATELMDKKIRTFAERQTENKRMQDDNNNQAQKQPPKKQGVAIAYIVRPGERKESPAATNNQRNPTFYKCGNQGHYRSDCLELKNQNHGNQWKPSWRKDHAMLRVNFKLTTELCLGYVGEVRFGKRGKLNPRYVGPSKVMEKVGSVAYKIELPQELSRVHHTFHVSNLKKCYTNEPLAVPLDGLHIDDKLHFVEEPVEIIDHEVKRLKRSCILIVKVRWNSRRGPEFTWGCEDQFRKKYPHRFTKTAPSSSVAS
ncbi:hypothetical protein Tco_0364648 [Tanacetum coccineum]